MAICVKFLTWILLIVIYWNECEAGLVANILIRFRRNNFKEDIKPSQYSYSAYEPPIKPLSVNEIITSLTNENENLKSQVSTLKTYVTIQKKQIIDIRKEKETIRREMLNQLNNSYERQEKDRETIKQDLRNAFEEEKIIMIDSFEEEKRHLKDDHIIEIEDIRKELVKKIEKQEKDIVNMVDFTSQQTKEIAEFKKLNLEASEVSKVIA